MKSSVEGFSLSNIPYGGTPLVHTLKRDDTHSQHCAMTEYLLAEQNLLIMEIDDTDYSSE